MKSLGPFSMSNNLPNNHLVVHLVFSNLQLNQLHLVHMCNSELLKDFNISDKLPMPWKKADLEWETTEKGVNRIKKIVHSPGLVMT